jgi:hypothetical protein
MIGDARDRLERRLNTCPVCDAPARHLATISTRRLGYEINAVWTCGGGTTVALSAEGHATPMRVSDCLAVTRNAMRLICMEAELAHQGALHADA